MSEPFIAEIRIVGFNFAPRGWALCNGQLLPISQNTALFSLIGTTYGGDGRTTMALPNLQGRAPMQPGHGPGLTARRLGERGGSETVTLTELQMPSHTHSAQGSTNAANDRNPASHVPAIGAGRGLVLYQNSTNTGAFQSLGNTGGSQPHDNLQPFLAMNFLIALVGLYPSRG